MSNVELEIFNYRKYWKYVDRVVKESKGGKKGHIQNTKSNKQLISKNMNLKDIRPFISRILNKNT